MPKNRQVNIRLEKAEYEQIQEIATEGNVSQWIRILIKRELEKLLKGE